jgi:hypothetical protein
VFDGGDILEVKIKDPSKRVYYRAKCPIHNKKRIREIIDNLRHFGVDVKKIIETVKVEKEEIWFK